MKHLEDYILENEEHVDPFILIREEYQNHNFHKIYKHDGMDMYRNDLIYCSVQEMKEECDLQQKQKDDKYHEDGHIEEMNHNSRPK